MTAFDIGYGRVAPTIRMRDIRAAEAFYARTLGFRTVFENGDPTSFIVLRKDDAEIHLAEDRNHRPSTINVAHMFVDDAATLYRRCEAAGVRIVKPLQDKDYGQRAFVLADPEGNRIDVGERASAAILAAEPQLLVSDMEHALGFFVDLLGFTIAFRHGEPAFYAQVARGGARLNLRLVARPAWNPELRAREPDLLSATLRVERIETLFDGYRSRGVPFHQLLRDEPWGARTFVVSAPDGNLIAFAGRGKNFRGRDGKAESSRSTGPI